MQHFKLTHAQDQSVPRIFPQVCVRIGVCVCVLWPPNAKATKYKNLNIDTCLSARLEENSITQRLFFHRRHNGALSCSSTACLVLETNVTGLIIKMSQA